MNIRLAIAAATISFCAITPTLADDCAGRIAQILTRSIDDVRPGRAKMTTEMDGAPTTVSEYLLAGPSPGLHKPLKPAGPTWTLTTPERCSNRVMAARAGRS